MDIVNLIDNQVSALSRIQIELFGKLTADEYNKVSEMIGELKEYLINGPTYFINATPSSNTNSPIELLHHN